MWCTGSSPVYSARKELNMDSEKNLTLRKLRNKIGYGIGWKFWDALKEYLAPKLMLVCLIIVWLYLSYHIDIHIVWK